MVEELERFLAYCAIERDFQKNTTISQYKADIEQFLEVVGVNKTGQIKHLKKEDIEKYLMWLNKKEYSTATYNKRISTLKSFFNFLEDEELVVGNIMRRFKTRRQKQKTKRVLTKEEALSLIEAASNLRDKTMLLCFLTGAFRVSELTHIKMQDVHFDYSSIFIIRKGGKEQEVQLPEETMIEIAKYIANYRDKKMELLGKTDDEIPWLFFSFRGNVVKTNSLNKIIKTAGRKAGILDYDKLHNHTFRTSYATQMHKDGVADKIIQVQMGHSNISTTLQSYVQVDNDQIRKQTEGKGYSFTKRELEQEDE